MWNCKAKIASLLLVVHVFHVHAQTPLKEEKEVQLQNVNSTEQPETSTPLEGMIKKTGMSTHMSRSRRDKFKGHVKGALKRGKEHHKKLKEHVKRRAHGFKTKAGKVKNRLAEAFKKARVFLLTKGEKLTTKLFGRLKPLINKLKGKDAVEMAKIVKTPKKKKAWYHRAMKIFAKKQPSHVQSVIMHARDDWLKESKRDAEEAQAKLMREYAETKAGDIEDEQNPLLVYAKAVEIVKDEDITLAQEATQLKDLLKKAGPEVIQVFNQEDIKIPGVELANPEGTKEKGSDGSHQVKHKSREEED